MMATTFKFPEQPRSQTNVRREFERTEDRDQIIADHADQSVRREVKRLIDRLPCDCVVALLPVLGQFSTAPPRRPSC